MKIRQDEPEDHDEIVRMHASMMKTAAIDDLMRDDDLPFGAFFVMEDDDGQLIGMMSARPYKDRFWLAGHFFLDSRFRGKGLGRKLLEGIADHFRALGVHAAVASEVPGSQAIPVLRAVGFKPAEQVVVWRY